MKLISNLILAIEGLVAIYALWLVYVYSQALWQLDKPTLITIGFCLAIYLFAWPDPKPKRINSKVLNPYHYGRK